MMRNTVLFIFVFMSILSCSKSNTNEIKDLDILTRMFCDENALRAAQTHGPWKVKLANGNIIGKVKSYDKEYSEDAMDKAYLGIYDENDYEIIIINVKDNTYKTIINDKYSNMKLLPIISNRTTETINDKHFITHQGKIYTPFFRCFILQTLEYKNTYKLIYLDNIDFSINNIIEKHYEYESTIIPRNAEITITPNFFIVYHYDIGEEYILINKKTNENKIIDTTRETDKNW
jgi:hypothetical protein